MNHRRCLLLVMLVGAVMTSAGCASFRSLPAAIPPAGWATHTTITVALALPPGYETVNTASAIDAMLARLEAQGPAAAPLAEQLASERARVLLLAADTAWAGAGCAPWALLERSDPLPGEVAMSQQAFAGLTGQLAAQLAPLGLVITRQERVRSGEILIARYVVSGEESCQTLAWYLIPAGDRLWSLTYGADAAAFPDLEPVFDQSAATFTAVTPRAE